MNEMKHYLVVDADGNHVLFLRALSEADLTFLFYLHDTPELATEFVHVDDDRTQLLMVTGVPEDGTILFLKKYKVTFEKWELN